MPGRIPLDRCAGTGYGPGLCRICPDVAAVSERAPKEVSKIEAPSTENIHTDLEEVDLSEVLGGCPKLSFGTRWWSRWFCRIPRILCAAIVAVFGTAAQPFVFWRV